MGILGCTVNANPTIGEMASRLEETVREAEDTTIGGMLSVIPGEMPEDNSWDAVQGRMRLSEYIHEEAERDDVSPWWVLKSLDYDERTDDVPENLIERAYWGSTDSPALEPVESRAEAPVYSCSM